MISSLSKPISGRSTGSVARVRPHVEVLERLRRDLADDVARHERVRTGSCREPLGDPHHQPAIDDDPERRRHGDDDALLQSAERARETAASAADGASGASRARAPCPGTRAKNRIAVEVHEERAASATNQPPRRNRRIDAAREQAHHLAAGADRQPAGARVALEEEECVDVRTSTRIDELRIAKG